MGNRWILTVAVFGLLVLSGCVTVTDAVEVRTLFPLESTRAVVLDGSHVAVREDVVVVDVPTNRRFVGVKFCLSVPVDLATCERMVAVVSNRSDRAAVFMFHGMRHGSDRAICRTRVLLPAYAERRIVASCAQQHFRTDEKTSIPGLNGYDRTSGNVKGDGKIHDYAGVDEFVVYRTMEDVPGSFEVKSLVLEGRKEPLTLTVGEDFYPFVDGLGQYLHAEWPGKVHSIAEMREADRKESEALGTDPASAIPGADRFGGWADGPQLEATGQFRVAKVNGRWWFVDPDGHLFFSQGVVKVWARVWTGVRDREYFFSAVPKHKPSLPCWTNYKSTGYIPCFYAGQSLPLFSWPICNFMRMYGEKDWKAKFADMAHRRMRAWGLNTIGNWSEDYIFLQDRTPYTDMFNLDYATRIKASGGLWRKFPDVFAPDFEQAVEKSAAETVKRSAKDPWCVGWFVENELKWGRSVGELTASVVASPDDQPAKVELLRRVKACHGAAAGFEALDDVDRRAYEEEIADRFFGTVRRVIARVAPGRLFLGSRFIGGTYPLALRVAAKHCDVVSFNIYNDYPVPNPAFPADIDRPMMVGEFHFGALDRGMLHTGLMARHTQAERAEAYKEYVRFALKDPRNVGVHWFTWRDQALTGRGDAEDYGCGFVDVTDRPYPEMVEAAKTLAKELYR